MNRGETKQTNKMGVTNAARDASAVIADAVGGQVEVEAALESADAYVFDVPCFMHSLAYSAPGDASAHASRQSMVRDVVRRMRAATRPCDEGEEGEGEESPKGKMFCFVVDAYNTANGEEKAATMEARAAGGAAYTGAEFDPVSYRNFYIPTNGDGKETYARLFGSPQLKTSLYAQFQAAVFSDMGDETFVVVTGEDACQSYTRVQSIERMTIASRVGGEFAACPAGIPLDVVFFSKVVPPVTFDHLPKTMRVSVARVRRPDVGDVVDAARAAFGDDAHACDPMLMVTVEIGGDREVRYTPLSLASGLQMTLEFVLDDADDDCTLKLVAFLEGISVPFSWTRAAVEKEDSLPVEAEEFTVTLRADVYACATVVKPREGICEGDHYAQDLALALALKGKRMLFHFTDFDWIFYLGFLHQTLHELGCPATMYLSQANKGCLNLSSLFEPENADRLDAFKRICMIYPVIHGCDYFGGTRGAGQNAADYLVKTWDGGKMPIVRRAKSAREGASPYRVSETNIYCIAHAASKGQYVASKGITKDDPLPVWTQKATIIFDHAIKGTQRLFAAPT